MAPVSAVIFNLDGTLLDDHGALSEVKLMPGASRLVRHLQDHDIRIGCATPSPRTTFERKLSGHQHIASAFDSVHCGDEVRAAPCRA